MEKEDKDHIKKMLQKGLLSLEEKKKFLGPEWGRKDNYRLKRMYQKGYLSLEEYKNILGPEWEKIDAEIEWKEAYYISKVFGFFFIDSYEIFPEIYKKKNMCKDAQPIKITFLDINQDVYEWEKYNAIMNKCIEMLDNYELLKKTGKSELIKSYKEKGKLTKILHENLSELEELINNNLTDIKSKIELKHLSGELKIKNILQSYEPNVVFSMEKEKVTIDLSYKLAIGDINGTINMGGVSVKFNEELKIIDMYRIRINGPYFA